MKITAGISESVNMTHKIRVSSELRASQTQGDSDPYNNNVMIAMLVVTSNIGLHVIV